MATRYCPSCGGEFVADTDHCPDCEVGLVEDPPGSPGESGDSARGEVAYDLADWSGEARAMVRHLVDGAGFPSAWEGTTLVVPAALEAQVDLLVDEAATADAASLVEPGEELVAFEVEDLSDAEYAALYQVLEETTTPFELDELGRLLVAPTDVGTVQAFLGSIGRDASEADGDANGEAADVGGYPDATDLLAGTGTTVEDGPLSAVTIGDEPVDGPVLIETLGEVFVACDRLAKHPTDAAAVLRFADGAAVLRRAALPFGFEVRTWKLILAAVGELLDDLESDDIVPDEEIMLEARAVRELVWPHV